MYAGHMVEIAPTAALFSHPRHPYTRGLIASIPLLSDIPKPVGLRLRGMLRRDELPPGCPFYPRCDFARPGQDERPQRLEKVAPGHFVACERWRELPAPALAVEGAGPARALSAGTPLLELSDVSLTYGGRGWLARLLHGAAPVVVRNTSFDVAPGETFALVGESGSGKSTIARAVSGLLEPVSGSIAFEGRPLPSAVRDRSAELRRRIQYIFQNPDASLNPRRPVGSTLARPLEMFMGLRGDALRRGVAAALDDVSLDSGYAARYPDQLSGGERQRVAIARALACEPALLLCDEILSALDVSVQASVLELLKQLRQEHEVAMLFIAHDLAVVRSLADRVGVLFRGTLFEIGAAPAVFAPPFQPYTHELLMAAPGQKDRRAGSGMRRFARLAGGAPAKGCAYAPRCAWKLGPICDREAPPWQDAGASLRIRCHRTIEDLRARAVWSPDAGSLVAETAAAADDIAENQEIAAS
jgi:peptide/nickel transport system ATP-binding protein